jgi:hypothetical protein
LIARGFCQSKIHRRKAKNKVIFLRKIRKTLFFGGRSMIAPTGPFLWVDFIEFPGSPVG